ncbi:class I SAM-dependent methyltransferase [Arthrobacter sp. TMS2-4]
MSVSTELGTADADLAAVEAFGERCIGLLNGGSIAVLMSIGHQTGLFDALATLPAATSGEIARTAGLNERYVREWLGGMASAGVLTYEPADRTFALPATHSALLTTAAGPDNLARIMQYVSMMGEMEQRIVDCFRNGGGLSYTDYPRFHSIMAEESAGVNDAALIDTILPLIPDLAERLRAGIEVADIGCGSGHAVNLMAKAFPASTFTGYDFSEEAIAAARAEATNLGLDNARFVLCDVAQLDETDAFDAITVFDAIHDQADPAGVLHAMFTALRSGGSLLMADIKASSNVEDNIELPWASFLYALSTVHCMSVSLGLDGAGLGTVWGTQLAQTMLGEAGFSEIEEKAIASDPFNAYFTASKG